MLVTRQSVTTSIAALASRRAAAFETRSGSGARMRGALPAG
jgi:hypothetical protein